MTDNKPFAPSADRNKHAIALAHFSHITWQPSDVAGKIIGMQQWIDESSCTNILPPVILDLNNGCAPEIHVSACYSANTLHIVSWPLVEALFTQAAQILNDNGKLIVYGPFKFDGKHISDGNRAFDEILAIENPGGGIRDVTDLNRLANNVGFLDARALDLPSNNHLLIWQCKN